MKLFFFTGFSNKILGKKIYNIDKLFKKKNIHCEYLFQNNMNFFLNGDNETHNSSDFIKKLKKKINNDKKFYFIGTSAGSFGALKYASIFNPTKIICFSPFTTLTKEAAKIDGRGNKELRKYLDKLENLGEKLEIKNILSDNFNYKSIYFYYARNNKEDSFQANAIANDLINLIPINTTKHGLNFKGAQQITNLILSHTM